FSCQSPPALSMKLPSLPDVECLYNGQVCGGLWSCVRVYLTASPRLRYFASHVRSRTTVYMRKHSQPHWLRSDACITLRQTRNQATKQTSDRLTLESPLNFDCLTPWAT